MHGTGTSLGDPIEVGGVAAVFGKHATVPASADTSPLALITSKSSMGHAEPAAGIVGVLHSLNAVQQGALPSLMHLRTLNPFVASALGSAHGNASFFLPRQLAPRAVCGSSSSQGLVSGVSSFAFQVGVSDYQPDSCNRCRASDVCCYKHEFTHDLEARAHDVVR